MQMQLTLMSQKIFVAAYFIKGLSTARAPSVNARIFKNKEIIQTGFSLISIMPFLKFPVNKFLAASISDPPLSLFLFQNFCYSFNCCVMPKQSWDVN